MITKEYKMFSRFGVPIIYFASLMFVSLQMSTYFLTQKETIVTFGRIQSIERVLYKKIFVFMAWK